MLAERGNKQIYKWINNKFPDEDKDSAENKTPTQMESNWKRVLSVMVQEEHSRDVPLEHRALEHYGKKQAMRGSGKEHPRE